MNVVSFSLYKRTIRLFPKKSYLEDSVVRHNRRQYVAAISYLKKSEKWSELWRE